MNLLEVKNLDLDYGKHSVLKDVSLNVTQGEFIGVLGVNGAGKTTLLKALLGLLPITAGNIYFQGKEKKHWDSLELAKKISYLEQSKKVIWPLYAEAVVRLGLYPFSKNEVSPTQVEDAMKRCDCLHLALKPIDQLSGGEQTLVLLARALVSNPDLLFVDEPIANLDPRHELTVMQLLASLAERGKSVFAVLHSLPLAARFCTRIILLHQGQIYATGTPKEVLTPENLRQVFAIEAHIENQNEKFFALPWKPL